MRRGLALLATCTLILPLLAQEPADDTLAKLKATPRYDQLRANLAVFRSLPVERQEAIRQLDRDLEALDAVSRDYREQALERYADWLERLPPADRERVLTAPDRQTRLRHIRAIREQQWLARLPKASRERIDKADDQARPALIQQLRQEERDLRADWQVMIRHWEQVLRNPAELPSRLEMLPVDVRDFVERELRPLLSRADEQRLQAAQGQWPRFPRVLVELTDDHPLSLLGPIGPTRLGDLPPHIQDLLAKDRIPALKGYKDKLKEAEGKWPEYGVIVRELSDKIKGKGPPLLPRTYTPAAPRAFTQQLQAFIERQLYPALTESERGVLRATEGVWPAYPRQVLDLARRHNLKVPPGRTLPAPLGQPHFWDRYRSRPVTSGELTRRERLFVMP